MIIIIIKLRKTHKKKFFLNVWCVVGLYMFLCYSVCWFLYGPFCHGFLKLLTSLQFILYLNFKLLNTCDYKLLTKIPSGALWLQDLWADNNLCGCVRWIVGSCNDYKKYVLWSNVLRWNKEKKIVWISDAISDTCRLIHKLHVKSDNNA